MHDQLNKFMTTMEQLLTVKQEDFRMHNLL